MPSINMNCCNLGEELPNEDEIYNVIISLKVVSILYSSHNLNPWNIFDSLFQDIDECQEKETPIRNLPFEALIYSIEACYFAITWGLYYIENQLESSQGDEVIKELRQKLDKYMAACFELTRDGPTDEIQEAVSCSLLYFNRFSYLLINYILKAYQSICDLLIIFSDQLSRNENPNVRSLEYKSTLDEQLILNNFVKHYVFTLKQDGKYLLI